MGRERERHIEFFMCWICGFRAYDETTPKELKALEREQLAWRAIFKVPRVKSVLEERICLICSTPYPAHAKTSKYCGAPCYEESKRRLSKVKYANRKELKIDDMP